MPSEENSNESVDTFDFGDQVDVGTFEQILDMDEGDDDDAHEFSSSIVFGYFDQGESTFKSMDEAVAAKDLEKLSSLGHFLKGSSATLGFTKVKDHCEKIQNFGHRKDETGLHNEPDDNKSLRLIADSIAEVKGDFAKVKTLMTRYYQLLNAESAE